MRPCFLLVMGVCLVAGGLARTAEEGSADERLLKEAKIGTDGPALIEFFRRRTVAADDAKIRELIKKLGDDAFEVREEASDRLVAIGQRTKERLDEASHSKDPEVARRARECLRRIARGGTAAVVMAATRALARSKSAGAAQALLTYLPAAEDENVAEEVRVALMALAVRDGKAEPALVAALTDKSPILRAAAGVALCRARAPGQLPAVVKLLKDPDASVRLRVGLVLVAAREPEAVPVLIALLDRVPTAQTSQVEDLLYRLAGDRAPTETPGKDEESRKRYRVAWQTWWKDHGSRLATARLEEATRTLGFTLVVLLDRGIIMELDAAKKPRWQIDGLQFPLDAQGLPGDRVLVAENRGNRVTERNRKNEVLWEKKIDGPLMAQRLPNGNTFIATTTQLVEVDRTGREVFTFSRPAGELFMRAKKLRNGDIACITQLGVPRYVRMDKTGRELKSFGVQVHTSGGRIEVLPNGHVLVPEMASNRLVELDANGKVFWEAAVDQPIAAVRLPNGHTLVTSMNQQRAIELDRGGKEVWEYKSDTRVTRAYRR